ncbi:MAG TPA: Na+/H+ antiporter subunit E [Thermomicrobiales bacterium]|jgi:multicomponent K+:H+ antiporter subunit E/multicomponent Na+:H+ antiporter subunit E
MLRYVGEVILLTTTYTFALASGAPWDILFGALLSVALLALFGPFLRGGTAKGPLQPKRLLAFFPFAGAVLRDIIIGTWTVLRIVLHPRPQNRPGIITVPIGERTRGGVAISALAMSLSPGSSLIAIDWERRIMLLHLLDATDPDAARTELQQFYDRYQRAVFP